VRLLAILALCLAACGGGGGGKPTFTPSADIAATHSWLLGSWRSSDPQRRVRVLIKPHPTMASRFDAFVSVGGYASDPDGWVEADGDQIAVAAENPFWGRFDLLGAVAGDEIVGQWSLGGGTELPTGGPVTMERTTPAPVTTLLELEVYESPDLLLIITRR